jgi:hypothetical protein
MKYPSLLTALAQMKAGPRPADVAAAQAPVNVAQAQLVLAGT